MPISLAKSLHFLHTAYLSGRLHFYFGEGMEGTSPKPVSALVSKICQILYGPYAQEDCFILSRAASLWSEAMPFVQDALRLDAMIQDKFPVIAAASKALERLEALMAKGFVQYAKSFLKSEGLPGVISRLQTALKGCKVPGPVQQIVNDVKVCDTVSPASLAVELDKHDYDKLKDAVPLYLKVQSVDKTFAQETMPDFANKIEDFMSRFSVSIKGWMKDKIKHLNQAHEDLDKFRHITSRIHTHSHSGNIPI